MVKLFIAFLMGLALSIPSFSQEVEDPLIVRPTCVGLHPISNQFFQFKLALPDNFRDYDFLIFHESYITPVTPTSEIDVEDGGSQHLSVDTHPLVRLGDTIYVDLAESNSLGALATCEDVEYGGTYYFALYGHKDRKVHDHDESHVHEVDPRDEIYVKVKSKVEGVSYLVSVDSDYIEDTEFYFEVEKYLYEESSVNDSFRFELPSNDTLEDEDVVLELKLPSDKTGVYLVGQEARVFKGGVKHEVLKSDFTDGRLDVTVGQARVVGASEPVEVEVEPVTLSVDSPTVSVDASTVTLSADE